MPKPAKTVIYNDGTRDLTAIVAEDHGGGSLDLYAPNGNNLLEIVAGVPRREKADWDESGGGKTWRDKA